MTLRNLAIILGILILAVACALPTSTPTPAPSTSGMSCEEALAEALASHTHEYQPTSSQRDKLTGEAVVPSYLKEAIREVCKGE